MKKIVDGGNTGQALTSNHKTQYEKKILLCIWWDMKDIIHYELLPPQTVNAESYQQLIRLSDELERKRPFTGHGTRHVILHDNVQPHVAKGTREAIYSLGWEVLPHAAYSPDLTPSDYHLFGSLQHHLATFQHCRLHMKVHR